MSTEAEQLIEILRLLALEPAEQCRVLPNFVDVPDELTTLFGDHYDVAKCQDSIARFAKPARELLDEVDRTFAGMGGRQEFYSMEAMQQGAEWVAIRNKARKVLDVLGVENRPPHLEWLSYVEGGR